MEDLLNPTIQPYMNIHVNNITSVTQNTTGNVDVSGTITTSNNIISPGIVLGGGSVLANYNAGGTFLPSLAFGGASVGITYSDRFGFFTRIGNICFFAFGITLSNKGSSVGNSSIGSLPIAPDPLQTNLTISGTNWSTIAFIGPTYGTVSGVIGTNKIDLNQLSNNSANPATFITDGGFFNTTSIKMTGFYFV